MSLYAGQLLGLLNKVVLFPFVFVGKEEYWGVMAFMLSVSSILGSLGTLGLNRVIIRFIPQHPDLAGSFVRKSLVWSGIGGILLVASGYFLIEPLASFSSNASLTLQFGLLLLLYLAGQWFFEMGNAIFSAYFKAQYGLFANNVSIRVVHSILLILCLLGQFGAETFLWLAGLTFLLNHAVLFMWALRSTAINHQGIQPIPSEVKWPEYAGFMVVLTLVSQSFLQLDAILVGHFLVFSQLAILDLAKNLSSIMDLPTRALGPSALAPLSRLLATGQLGDVARIYTKASFVQIFIGLVMFAVLGIHLEVLIGFLPNSDYALVKPLFFIMAAGKLIDLATGLNWAIITNSQKYWANLYIGAITLVVILGLEWWLIPIMGLMGAAWGISLAYLLNNLLRTWYVWHTLGLLPFDQQHKRLIVLLTCTFLVIVPWPMGVWNQVIVKDFLLALALVWYLPKGRTIPEWDELVAQVGNRLKALLRR
jgi:O-antigen/teichoic acid export membrane protein